MENCTVVKYLQLVKLELEDLRADLEASIRLLEKRFKEMDITNYVFLENMATIRSELIAVDHLEKLLESESTESSGCDEIRTRLDDHFTREVKEGGFPEAVLAIIKRKLDKIDSYIKIVG